MALAAVLPYTLPEYSQLLYVKTHIGGFFFDAFLKIDHVTKLKITEHPVQEGAALTDHAYLEPAELTMEIGMSDVAQSLVTGQFAGGLPRSVNAYKILREMQEQRVPLMCHTRLRTYQNMLIETISVSDDYLTQYGLKATVTLREILVAKVTTVKISARAQTTGSTPKGVQEVVKPNVSLGKQLDQALFGGAITKSLGGK